MGLDQYAYITNKSVEDVRKLQSCEDWEEFENATDVVWDNVWCGRKVNCLQGYLERELNIENVVYYELTLDIAEEMLEYVEADIKLLHSIMRKNGAKKPYELYEKIVNNENDVQEDVNIFDKYLEVEEIQGLHFCQLQGSFMVHKK